MKLIFVYNAKAGIRAGLFDSIHKLVSPATYRCALCAITYGPFRMDARWKAWISRLPFPVDFHHKQDFAKAYPDVRVALPAILTDRDGEVKTLVTALDMQALETVDDLVALINRRLKLAVSPPAAAPATP